MDSENKEGQQEGRRPGHRRLSQDEIKKNREIAVKRWEEQLAEARKNIDSKDDALRLKAVSHLDTSDANDLKRLENALMTDASSEIREEAAIQLSDGDPKVTVPALLNALTDHEADVTIAAMESLSATDVRDKAEIVAAIKNIRSTHTDEEVREVAQAALEQLE